MHWSDKYPHDLYASVLLLDGKIENWKVVDYPKKTPGIFSGFWKRDRLKDYTVQTQKWTVNNFLESQDAFNKHAPAWFRQWPHADDYIGFPAYGTPMQAITVWQPWATLIALRIKRFETRGWLTKYRGPLAIHAAKHVDLNASREDAIRSVLSEYGFTSDNLPTGAVVATAVLNDCVKSVDTWTDGYILENGVYVYSPEYEFGDFTPGRFAWELTEVAALQKPIPAKGKQRIWNWDGGFL
ncbi:ASCH domain-containing protein [Cohnella boryungensis]|uniref:ASCH domain-containing protein n=1 Tax=Cohnella boryungensis TaxID=768479 RepID=A0ABV8SDZ1_9BACL